MEYSIREMQKEEYTLLEEFLYEAIFLPEGIKAPPRTILQQAELQVYIKDFGKERADKCLVAEIDNVVVGAVWVRLMDDYGKVDDETPSLAISLFSQYRGHGIGTALMKAMLSALKEMGYAQCSLSVQKENYAVKMYDKVGFEVWKETEEEYIMICNV